MALTEKCSTAINYSVNDIVKCYNSLQSLKARNFDILSED